MRSRTPACTPTSPPAPASTPLAEWREARRFLQERRDLAGLVLVDALLSLVFGAVNVLTVPFLVRVVGTGSTGLGGIMTAQGAGALLTSLAVGTRLKLTSARPIIIAALGYFSLSTFLYTLVLNYWLMAASGSLIATAGGSAAGEYAGVRAVFFAAAVLPRGAQEGEAPAWK